MHKERNQRASQTALKFNISASTFQLNISKAGNSLWPTVQSGFPLCYRTAFLRICLRMLGGLFAQLLQCGSMKTVNRAWPSGRPHVAQHRSEENALQDSGCQWPFGRVSGSSCGSASTPCSALLFYKRTKQPTVGLHRRTAEPCPRSLGLFRGSQAPSLTGMRHSSAPSSTA